MRKLTLPGILLCLVFWVAVGACGADTITSQLGRQGPAFAPGTLPSTLGWGTDDQPYPDKFVVNPKDGAEMVWVPPGEFMMGSTPETQDTVYRWSKTAIGDRAKPEAFSDEGPQHKVRITKGFWLYRFEVTNAQYRQLKADHNSGEAGGQSLNADEQPVASVSWNDARQYSEWAGTRLPTEAEWEYACRAGTQTMFWWGDSEQEAGKYANVADRKGKALWPAWATFDTDDGYAVASPVGSYQANSFGLYDMIGNAWEFCADWYDQGYYANSPQDDPPGPSSGRLRVRRGGSWVQSLAEDRSAYRGNCEPDKAENEYGFRCAVTP